MRSRLLLGLRAVCRFHDVVEELNCDRKKLS
jgi:hypothetical protein